jgi:hypothetical protein
LSERLYKNYPVEITDYIHHFLDEENKHMLWFGTYCEKYAGKIYQDKKLVFPREFAKGEQEFLFFAKVVVFEEIVDKYNLIMSKDETLSDLERQIHRQHHIDESRHLSFGREIAKFLFEKHRRSDWNKDTFKGIQNYLSNYIVATWGEYYNPEVYADAGIENPYDLRDEVWNLDKSREFRLDISKKLLDFFLKSEFISEAPKL